MSKSNNSGNVPGQPSDDDSIAQSIAELKQAIGLLWRRVDQAEINADQKAKDIQEKIDTWIATNRALLEVIALNSQETTKAIASSENVSLLCVTLSNQLQQFEQVIKESQQTSPQPNISLVPSPDLQVLSNQIQEVQTTIERVDTNTTATWTVMTPLATHTGQISKDLENLCGTAVRFLAPIENGIDKIPQTVTPKTSQIETSSARGKSSFSSRSVGLGIAIVIGVWFGLQRFDQFNHAINDLNTNLIQWRKSTK